MKSLKLESWETDKQPYVRIFSQSLAIESRNLFENLIDVINNKIPKEFDPPAVRPWIKYYRSHRKLWRFFTSQYMQLGGVPALHAQAFQSVTQRLPPDHSLAIDQNIPIQSIPTVKEAYAIFYSYVRDDIAKIPFAEESKTVLRNTFLCHDFLFVMKIVLPMWLLYGKNCITVYRHATQGDIQALDYMLRFDKMQVQNPRINKWIYNYSCTRNQHNQAIILDAIAGSPRARLTMRRVKYLLAGYISVSSELFGHRLTAPEIQSLFDAVAVDYGIDPLRDPDLPDSPEAFSKAIQREREFWMPILFPKPDKTIY